MGSDLNWLLISMLNEANGLVYESVYCTNLSTVDIIHNGNRLLCISEFSDFSRSNVKSYEFWNCSKSPKAMIIKVLYRFLISYIVLWQYEVLSDSKHGSFNAQHFFFRFFLLYLKKTFNLLCNEE